MHPGQGEPWGENDGSCVLLVSSRTARALLVADIEHDAEAELAAAQIRADVVLVPHHGSRSSSTPEFVAATHATIAIVSAGFGNRWGLPRPDVSARWRGAGARLITTADAGAITAAAAPGQDEMTVTAFRDRHRRWWRSGAMPAYSGTRARR
jgi:competence protein ComEC